jgi:Protein of unknown function (DUF2934)
MNAARGLFMVKKASSAVVKTPSKTKSSAKKARAAPAERSPAIEFASLPDETRIRERAYAIWIEEGRRHRCDLADWRRVRSDRLRRRAA